MTENEGIEEVNTYEDIIHLPHHRSLKHAHMSLADRAAQFAPFAALTGHEEAVKEIARLTVAKIELDENAKAILDRKLQVLMDCSEKNSLITITYFMKDDSKEGGRYEDCYGYVKKIDEYTHKIIMSGGEQIPIDDILGMKGAIFSVMELS